MAWPEGGEGHARERIKETSVTKGHLGTSERTTGHKETEEKTEETTGHETEGRG